MIVDTHVHVVSDDQKAYPQVTDGAHGAGAPSVRDLGQVEWPALTVEKFSSRNVEFSEPLKDTDDAGLRLPVRRSAHGTACDRGRPW